MEILAIIPARLESTRLPGKVLLDIHGKSMIQRVYEQVYSCNLISKVIIACDSEEIYTHAMGFRAEVMMTSKAHQSGTDRCAEVANQFPAYDYVINMQADEPFILRQQLEQICKAIKADQPEILTLYRDIKTNDEIHQSNIVKIVLDKQNFALYFSRQAIPFIRGVDKEHWYGETSYFAHIGLYAFKTKILTELTKLHQGTLEKAEALEQLRWLENGFKITCLKTAFSTMGIDTAEDLEAARKYASVFDLSQGRFQ